MSDRDALLATIRAYPDADMPRLVFADWLDENANGCDLDIATAEFIRLSCPLRKCRSMPRAAYQWLDTDDNWKRLVPSAPLLTRPKFAYRDGRVIRGRTAIALTTEPRHGGRRFNLHFHRGFLLALEMWATADVAKVWPAVRHDQPLAELWGASVPYL